MTENLKNALENPDKPFTMVLAMGIISFLRANESPLIKQGTDGFTEIKSLVDNGYFEIETEDEETEGFYKFSPKLFRELTSLMMIWKIRNLNFGEDLEEFAKQHLENCFSKN